MKVKGILLVLSLLISMSIVNSFGINQDYPSKFTMMPGDEVNYGIRISNPSNDCIGVKITKTESEAVSNIINEQDTYYLQPNSTQKIFVKIKVPLKDYSDTYTIKYRFNTISVDNPNTVVDVNVGAASSITVTVVKNATGNRPQRHTQTEINSVINSEIVKCELPVIPVAKPTNIAEDIVDKASVAVGIKNETAPAITSMNIKDKGQEDIIFGAIIVGCVLIVSGTILYLRKKRKENREKMNQNESVHIVGSKSN